MSINLSRVAALTVGLVCCLNVAGESKAASLRFDMTFDGTSISLDAGSTDPAGSSLSPGDSFVADLHATSGNIWRVDAAFTQFAPMTFIVDPTGIRDGDVVSSFLLNGVEVINITELGVSQRRIHLGAQDWTLPVGLEFDTVVVSYELTSATEELDATATVATTIVSKPDIFSSLTAPDRPFFRHPSISFVALPEPATIGLALFGLLGLGFQRRS